jgi:methylphosphotriester-DNA--protein-cysteine methyltransferase
MLTYAETEPDAGLRPFIQSFWTWDADLAPGERFVHHVWPDGCVLIVVNFAPNRPASGTVVGPGVEPRRIVMQGRLSCRGLRFRPEAGAALLGMRAVDLCDRSTPLADTIGPEAIALIEAVAAPATHRAGLSHLRTWLRRRLSAQQPPIVIDRLVSRAVDTLAATHGQAGIRHMAGELNVSTRQLERRFQQAVGLTPKQYARIRRMRSLLTCVLDRNESWAAMAAELGYADQAHCARELSRLTGLTPRALATRLRAITHHAVRP